MNFSYTTVTAVAIANNFFKLHAEAHEGFDALDIILDALIDSAKMIPFLFLAFLLMELIEHKARKYTEKEGRRTFCRLCRRRSARLHTAVRIFRCGSEFLQRKTHHNGYSRRCFHLNLGRGYTCPARPP